MLIRFYFSQPHIELELMVENPDGSIELWSIESTSPQHWQLKGLPRTIDEMLLSAITTEKGKVVITDQVKQRRARENIPALTIKRD